MAEKARAWNRANRDRFNENKRKSYQRNKRSPNQQRVFANYQRHHARVRSEVYAAYGGAFCACCGESNLLFLTIDHTNNDGAAHRAEIWGKSRNGSGSALCGWLKKHGFPPGYQVLCYNCNCGKQRNGGTCPHLSNEGVTTIPTGSTPKRAEAHANPLSGLMI